MIGRYDIDGIDFDGAVVAGFDDGHRGLSREQFDHGAFMFGVEVGNNDKGHAGRAWHGGEEAFKSIESAGGSDDSHDWKVGVLGRGGSWGRIGHRCRLDHLLALGHCVHRFVEG